MILPLWQSGDIDSLKGILAEGARFSTPMTEYQGRKTAAHIFGLIAGVLEDVEKTAAWYSEGETACSFTGRVHEDQRQGMLHERRGETGHLVEVTLFLRPSRALGKAIGRMRELLAENPLPSGSA